jgi:hypothetical protein
MSGLLRRSMRHAGKNVERCGISRAAGGAAARGCGSRSAVVEIFTELAFGDALFEVGVGRGQNADVNRLRTVFARPA